ncbi:MAG: hypothetical protein ACLQAT_26350 [Candidatus Binataceae bacterium]
MPSPSVDDIALQVRQSIESTFAQAQAAGLPDRQWTFNILSELTRLGRGYGFKVRGAKPPKDDFETGWLWDLTWVDIRNWHRPDSADGKLVELPLVLESEWNVRFVDEILWDFQKLLVARAHLRVMIFQQATKQKADQCLESMRDAIKTFSATHTGDRYLFACWIYTESRTLVEDHVV